jgi:hypothetical protein
VTGEELAVFAREDVIGHSSYAVLVTESKAKLKHQGSFA